MIKFLSAIAFALLSVSQALSHAGEDHSGQATAITVQTAPRAFATSQLFELVAVSNGTALSIYLDDYTTNAPISGASITGETPAGSVEAVAEGDIYRIDAPWAATPGEYELLFTVTSGTDVDFLTASLSVPKVVAAPAPNSPGGLAGFALAHKVRDVVATTIPDRLKQFDPALIIIGGLGFLGGAAIMALMRRRVLAAGIMASLLVVVIGTSVAMAETATQNSAQTGTIVRDVAQRMPDGRVFAPKSTQRILAILTIQAVEAEHRRSIELPGRVIPDPNASGFVQTAIGGRLLPPPGGFPNVGSKVEAGQLMALVEPKTAAADQSSIRLSKTNLEQQIALATRQVERFRTLAKSGSLSRTQLEEAELKLNGLLESRASLDAVRMEAEQLVAPVAGVLSKAEARPGLIAATNTEIFHIIDPARIWVEALSFNGVPVSGDASTNDQSGKAVNLSFAGAGLAEDGQAQPVHFKIEDATGRLRIGERVIVVAQTEAITKGIAAPRKAVIRGANGEDIVFVHVAPELFEPRAVRTEALDGDSVIIVAGIAAGDRLVTQGAELLNQLR